MDEIEDRVNRDSQQDLRNREWNAKEERLGTGEDQIAQEILIRVSVINIAVILNVCVCGLADTYEGEAVTELKLR